MKSSCCVPEIPLITHNRRREALLNVEIMMVLVRPGRYQTNKWKRYLPLCWLYHVTSIKHCLSLCFGCDHPELDPTSFPGFLIFPRENMRTSCATSPPNLPENIVDMSSYVNCYSNALNSLQFGKCRVVSIMYQCRKIVKIELRRTGQMGWISKLILSLITAWISKRVVFRGRWHGDIMIHTRQKSAEQDLDEFLKEVSVLSMIRHENVVLFMGACLEPPNLAVITR